MKTLKFAPELVDLVISGTKTTTWRLFDDKNLQAGDQVELIRRPELTPFAEAEIISVVEKPLKELTPEDKDGHEKFESDEPMYHHYSIYYKRQITPETPVKIVKFKIIKFI